MASGFAHTKLKNQVTALSNFHARTDQGLAFTTEVFDLTLAAAGELSILCRVSATNQLHLIPRITTGGEATLHIFENPTVTADGAALTPINYKRASTYNALSNFTSAPTVTADGLLLDVDLIPGGSGGSASGGASGLESDWVLGPGGVYLFRLTNLSSQVKIAMLHLDFYEVGVGE